MLHKFYPRQMVTYPIESSSTNPSTLSQIQDSGKVRLTTTVCSLMLPEAAAPVDRLVAINGLAEVIMTPSGTGLALNWKYIGGPSVGK